ncbi:tyrosine-type recombinase/integrase [Chitinophaga varians]|uniref:Tyrosine-type recombinase/integrase n=1 Tax=Chitinophaga varians TaxID=2202339 RepID=A0A847S514_9BACT|nr:tyrosine-type recombinase/integrase [Chitinophaga varians]NLR68535.1 tyrosine-type recombinase/integrase [Chitinophaga varians]
MEVKSLIYTLRKIKKSGKSFKEGEYEVRIRLSQYKEKEFISLGYSSSVENWDEVHMLPKPSHPHYKELSKKINRIMDDIDFELKKAQRSGRFISCIEVKRAVLHTAGDLPLQHDQLKILEFFDKVINELEEAGNPGYADVFESTRSTVSKLINNKFIPADEREREKDKPFLAFTKDDHQKYERLVSAGASESTISLYLRTYYRIWNLAIKEGYCTREEHHPSKFIKFRAYKRIRTKKRSINQDFLQDIIDAKFDPGSRIFRSHLILQFMYYGRGINFGDVCKLRREDVANGTLCYTRSKNHREYDYTLHPRAIEIVEYFKNYPQQSDAGYLFPVLFSRHDTARKVDSRIHHQLRKFNEDLKKMAEMVGWERKFTSYSLRHGFATHLRNNDVDISIIKEALGHETEEQTVVYLEELDDKPVADAINKALTVNKRKPEKQQKKGRRI